jgi:NAD(P)-dependent dehydrogenase (short-subunit alcohol dehydrogenase family)
MAIAWEMTKRLFGPKTHTETFLSDLSFAGRNVLTTGATSGLGLETAIHYVNLGADPVFITDRTALDGVEAQKAIEDSTGKTGVIQVRTLDMDTFGGAKKLVNSLSKGNRYRVAKC